MFAQLDRSTDSAISQLAGLIPPNLSRILQSSVVARESWYSRRADRKAFANLFDQQMWCWGADIRCSKGNLLIEYGFERDRPPHGLYGSTAYRIEKLGLSVTVWGFAFLCVSPTLGTLVLKRYDEEPRWTAQELDIRSIWQAGKMPRLGAPSNMSEWQRAHQLFENALLFIEKYEEWVRTTMGVRYRISVSKMRGKRGYCKGDLIPQKWRELIDAHSFSY